MLSIGEASPRPVEDEGTGAGLVRGVLGQVQTPSVWNRFRLRGALATLVVCVVLGVVWGWAGGFAIAAIAAIAFIDAYRRQMRGSVALLPTVILDISLVGAGVFIADLNPAGIGAPFVYMMAVPLLLFPMRKALPLMLYGTVWGAIALAVDSPLPLPASVNPAAVSAIAYAIFTVLLLSLIAVLGRSLDKAQQFSAERLRAEAALAVAGEELLSNATSEALTNALEGIREATGAAAAFVAENSGDRHTGPAAVVRQVSAAADTLTDSTSIKWTLPYMQHREAAAELAKGKSVRLDDSLGTVMGREPGSTAAFAVPISVRGEWAGFMGVAYDEDPLASEPDLHVLETIAAMMGAFIERRQAYGRLEKLVHSKDQFLASISHEIRTPLTSILGFAAVLREDPDRLKTDEALELVKLIQLQSQDVSDLVEDLLVAARTEIDAVTITKEPVDLSAEIERVLAARLDSEERDVFVAASPRHVALADPTRVRQILRNLLTNALRYGGEEITITTHRDAPEVTLVFSDNGDGVPPEHQIRVFDPYHRGQTALTTPESIGLGLAVSRQLARLMDGDLTLRSDLGPATFQLSLPMAPKPSENGGRIGGRDDQEAVRPSESISLAD